MNLSEERAFNNREGGQVNSPLATAAAPAAATAGAATAGATTAVATTAVATTAVATCVNGCGLYLSS